MALRIGWRLAFSPGGGACLGYVESLGARIALGEPAGPPDELGDLVEAFVREARAAGCQPVFCGISDAILPIVEEHGLCGVAAGDRAIVDPSGVTLHGKAWADVRGALNRGQARGLRFSWIDAGERDGRLMATLAAVSRDWRRGKRLPELGFAFGDPVESADPRVRLAVAHDAWAAIAGFATWVPVPARGGWMLETLRSRRDALPGAAAYLVASSLLAFKKEGLEYANLGGVPLAYLGARNAPMLPRHCGSSWGR